LELKLATGTIVDATIINAPSSTENANEARNREMQQTKKRASRGIRHG
jgi:IS5 family transposase